MNPKTRPQEDDQKLEALSDDIARIVRRTEPGRQEELRQYAAELVRSSTEGEDVSARPSTAAPRGRRVSLFGVGLLLLAVGFGLVILVPPVGATIAALAVILLVAGAATALAGLGSREIEST